MKKILIALFFIGLISLVVAIPNPAPIYCENMGHVSNGVNCIFDDGESCELWDFYNGECGPDYVKELACVELGESLSPGKVCCEGLVGKTPARIGGDGICGMIVGSFGVCVACGDGVCDEAFENRCNCAEDCNGRGDFEPVPIDGEPDENICMAWWEGWVYSAPRGECLHLGSSGCINPYEYDTEEECNEANEVEETETDEIEDEETEEEEVEIESIETNRLRIRKKGVSAETELELSLETIEEETKLEVRLSNGRNAEIKVMPGVASETALARLRLKVCSEENNCSIELKEVGKGDGLKVAYEVQTRKQVKFWGLFRTRAQVKVQVDAESGEIISVSKPWWAVLVDEDY